MHTGMREYLAHEFCMRNRLVADYEHNTIHIIKRILIESVDNSKYGTIPLFPDIGVEILHALKVKIMFN